jgi:hypothetical protein
VLFTLLRQNMPAKTSQAASSIPITTMNNKNPVYRPRGWNRLSTKRAVEWHFAGRNTSQDSRVLQVPAYIRHKYCQTQLVGPEVEIFIKRVSTSPRCLHFLETLDTQAAAPVENSITIYPCIHAASKDSLNKHFCLPHEIICHVRDSRSGTSLHE